MEKTIGKVAVCIVAGFLVMVYGTWVYTTIRDCHNGQYFGYLTTVSKYCNGW